MPSISDTIEICVEMFKHAPTSVPILIGPPGVGKSACRYDIARGLDIPEDRIGVVHIGNHEVVDFSGVPSVVPTPDSVGGGMVGLTVFNPTELFWPFRDGTGPGLIVLEELPQSTVHHQTWTAGFVLERCTSTFNLDPEVRILLTGNRQEDRSGAKPLLAHLSNRLTYIEVETSLDDWCDWALDNDVDPIGVAFLRFRPALLNDFDPMRKSNPTQRSWTAMFREVPTTLPKHLYLMACAGRVGEGAASEWVAARDLMGKMPSVDAVRLAPTKVEVPEEPAVRFAIATALSASVAQPSFAVDMEYVARMPPEFQMVYVSDVVRRHPKLCSTAPFIKWSLAHRDVIIGSE